MERGTIQRSRGVMRFRSTGIVVKVAKVQIFLRNGQAYVSTFKYPVLLAVTLKVYLPNQNNATLGIISLIAMFLMGILGWFDLKHIRLAQTTADINTKKYNPYFTRLEKDLKSLNSKVGHGKRSTA